MIIDKEMIIDMLVIFSSSSYIFCKITDFYLSQKPIVYRIRIRKGRKMENNKEERNRALRDAYTMLVATKTETEMIAYVLCKIDKLSIRGAFERQRKGLSLKRLTELCINFLILVHTDEGLRKETLSFEKPSTMIPPSTPNAKLGRIALNEIPQDIKITKKLPKVAPAKGSDHSALSMAEHEPKNGRYSSLRPSDEDEE